MRDLPGEDVLGQLPRLPPAVTAVIQAVTAVYVLLMCDLPGEDVLGQLARLPPGPRPVARPQLEAEVEELGDHLQRRHLAEPVQGEPGSTRIINTSSPISGF